MRSFSLQKPIITQLMGDTVYQSDEFPETTAVSLADKVIEDPTGVRDYFAPGPDENDIEYARHLVAGKEKNGKPIPERARALYLVEKMEADPDIIALQENGNRLYGAIFRDDEQNAFHQIIAEVEPDGQRARMVTSFIYKDDSKSKNKAMKQFGKILSGRPIYIREGVIKERADGGSPHAYQLPVSQSEPGLLRPVNETVALQQDDVNLREGIKKAMLSGAPRMADRPSVSRPEPELRRPVDDSIALQQSDVNSPQVDCRPRWTGRFWLRLSRKRAG